MESTAPTVKKKDVFALAWIMYDLARSQQWANIG